MAQVVSQDQRRIEEALRKNLKNADTTKGGAAWPWLQVPMVPLFGIAAGIVVPYYTLDASQITTEKVLWSSTIGQVAHADIALAGTWGQASGSNNTTYNLKANGSLITTWSVGALSSDVRGPFSISGYTGVLNVVIDLTAVATGTGNVACHVNGCWQRPT